MCKSAVREMSSLQAPTVFADLNFSRTDFLARIGHLTTITKKNNQNNQRTPFGRGAAGIGGGAAQRALRAAPRLGRRAHS